MHQPIPHKVSVNGLFFIVVAFAIIFVISSDKSLTYEIESERLLASIEGLERSGVENLSWTQISQNSPWGKRDSHEIYEWNDNLYLFGGLDATGTFVNGLPNYEKAKYYNDIWKSADGINWTLEKESSNLPPMRSMSIVPFKGRIFLMGGWGPTIGYNKNIWTSEDGKSWKKEDKGPEFGAREGGRMLVSKGKMYVFGGVNYEQHKRFNDVWVSENGFDWEVLTESAPWHSRWDHDVAYFNNKFVLYGGMDTGDVGFNDLWTSPDAINWTLVSSDSEIGKIQGQVLVSYKNILFLVGGLDAKTNLGTADTWFSFNGRDWNKIPDGAWAPREDHRATIFKDKLFIYGGMSDKWEWLGDSWVIPLNNF